MSTRSSLLFTMPLLIAAAALSASLAQAAPLGPKTTKEAINAMDSVNAAASIVKQMEQDPRLSRLIDHSYGVFVVPHFGSGAFIVGGHGGGGMVLARRHGVWSNPAFYNISGGSIGLQAGGTSGAVAMILMTRKAMDRFENGGSWSLSGNAGLTVANWSGEAQASSGTSDVVVWTDVKGFYGGLTAGATKMSPDLKLDDAFYQRHTDTHQILMGRTTNPTAEQLRYALGTRVATE